MKAIFLILVFALPVWAGLPMTKDEKAWLKTVRIIMTRQEEKTFKKMKSHEDRKEFMALFWAKRDEDLTDQKNEFRDEFLARLDYVVANYNEFRNSSPKTDRGYIYLLLGPPERIDYRADYMIVGFNFRNPYPHYPPELWVYENLPFKGGSRIARVQMLAVNSFGDYRAFADSQVEHLLRTIKYDFIKHPDLEEVPSNPIYSEDFQVTLNDPSENRSKEKQAKIAPATQTNQTQAMRKESLAVPSPKQPELTEKKTKFNPQLENEMALLANSGYFYSGEGKTMSIIRMGFPMDRLEQWADQKVRFTLSYTLKKSGESVFDFNVPFELEPVRGKTEGYFSQEWAGNLEPGVYTLWMQWDGPLGASFAAQELTVPSMDVSNPIFSPINLLDPNVSLEQAKLRVGGRGFSPLLLPQMKAGVNLYPFVEILNTPNLNSDDIEIQVWKGEKQVKSWRIYPEELTKVNDTRNIMHPSLRTNSLHPGNYVLRIELPLENGDILIREADFTIL